MGGFKGEEVDVSDWDQLGHSLYVVASRLLPLGTPKYQNGSHVFPNMNSAYSFSKEYNGLQPLPCGSSSKTMYQQSI